MWRWGRFQLDLIFLCSHYYHLSKVAPSYIDFESSVSLHPGSSLPKQISTAFIQSTATIILAWKTTRLLTWPDRHCSVQLLAPSLTYESSSFLSFAVLQLQRPRCSSSHQTGLCLKAFVCTISFAWHPLCPDISVVHLFYESRGSSLTTQVERLPPVKVGMQ